MNSLRAVLVLAVACLCISASATPEFLNKFKAVYAKPNAKCVVCHTDPPKRNDYGQALRAAMDAAGKKELTKEIFESIEKDDADKDGVSNGDEIKAGTMPGDAKSKPAAGTTPKPEPPAELVPKHTFHPAIVHFPIALLAVAALLEIVSRKKSDEFYHRASVINLAIGLVSSLGAITTGVIAWLRMGTSLEGNLLIHLIVASLSILVGIGAYVQREKSPYLILMVISAILVGVAGHFGGSMVYG